MKYIFIKSRFTDCLEPILRFSNAIFAAWWKFVFCVTDIEKLCKVLYYFTYCKSVRDNKEQQRKVMAVKNNSQLLYVVQFI